MTDGLEMSDSDRKPEEIILFGYFLTRCAVVSKGGASSLQFS